MPLLASFSLLLFFLIYAMFFHNFLHIQNNFGAYTSSIQYHLWQTALSISVCQLVSGILLDSGVWSSRDSSTGWCWGFCRCLGYEFRARQAFAENVETNNCFNWKKACKMRQMLFTLGLGASPGPSTAGMPLVLNHGFCLSHNHRTSSSASSSF